MVNYVGEIYQSHGSNWGYFQTGDFWGPTLVFYRCCFRPLKISPGLIASGRNILRRTVFQHLPDVGGARHPGGGEVAGLPGSSFLGGWDREGYNFWGYSWYGQ